jgi:hypothetical protein
MNTTRPPLIYKGKSLGIFVLVAAQILVGAIHVFFGFWLLSASGTVPFVGSSTGSDIYIIYTIVFSLLTLIFAGLVWLEKQSGWVGTAAVAVFVIIADSLTLLNLPSVPRIPKFAGFGEISYSILVIAYLLQAHVRAKYKIKL